MFETTNQLGITSHTPSWWLFGSHRCKLLEKKKLSNPAMENLHIIQGDAPKIAKLVYNSNN